MSLIFDILTFLSVCIVPFILHLMSIIKLWPTGRLFHPELRHRVAAMADTEEGQTQIRSYAARTPPVWID